MEKLVIKSNKRFLQFNTSKLLLILIFIPLLTFGQTTDYVSGRNYTIDSISVQGLKTFNHQTLISYTGLFVGQQIKVPGEVISSVINKLWNLDLFSNINVYATRISGNNISIEIEVDELPTLSKVSFRGIKKGKQESLTEETELTAGKKLSESFLTNTRNYIIETYKDDGFLNAKVTLNTRPDSLNINQSELLVFIDRGTRVKISDIDFKNNEVFRGPYLRKKLKNTKKKNKLRFWKKSKFIEEDYQEDLISLVEHLKEKGYRDARILSDTIIPKNDRFLSINIEIEEGDQYYFGDIDFVGNTVYSDYFLKQKTGIQKGDIYNSSLLKKRISEVGNPDADNVENLYKNNGYLFSNINLVEVSAERDTIDFEVRISEGKLAQFNKISVSGNDRTNDHVIYREIRTRPGQIYSQDQLVRSIRELGQLGYFDAEKINPNFDNADPNAGTVDISFPLTETGASQIQLQGGYGGGGFIGTLGLSFNNFSMRNIFNGKEYKPLPMGDGQNLSLRLQSSQFYNTYSFSFSEPWLGGRQPVNFSTSFSHTIQYRYDYFTGRADKSQSFQISGASIGLARRLQIPDDYFQLSQSLAYQYYDFNNYFTGLFTFGNGVANNFAYEIALSRNNTFTNPIFPIGGSTFTIRAKLTPPYSLLSNIDYADLENQPRYQDADGNPDRELIDQERFRWLEFYKIKFNGTWYTPLINKFVLKTQADFGFIGAYDNDRGLIPFERFYLGGDGMQNYALDGRENIALRGYDNQSLSSRDGSIIYNKFTIEVRYPISLKPAASIFALTFLESGNGYDRFKDFNPFNSKRSAGGGIRIFMPAFGLLGIDFGYGFDNPNSPSGEANGWETHFIIGQQF